MTKTIELGEKPNWLIYDDNWGGIDINQSTDTDTIHNIYWYGFTILANGVQMYFDKPEMLVFLKCFTDKKNQSVLRKEMSKLEEELTEGENRIDEKENSV